MKTVISIRRPASVDIPQLIARLRELDQTYASIAQALGVTEHQVKHWGLGQSKPSLDDGLALLVLAEQVETLARFPMLAASSTGV